MLAVLEATFIGRWIDALSDTTPARAVDTAQRLWTETASAWEFFATKTDELLRTWGVDGKGSALSDLLEGTSRSIRDVLPNVTATASVYLDAFVRLTRNLMGHMSAHEATRAFFGVQPGSDAGFHGCMALFHGFLVAASTPSVSAPVQNVLVRTFWQRLRAFVEDDDTIRKEVDMALRIAASEAPDTTPGRKSHSAAGPSRPTPVLLRLAQAGRAAPQIWSSVPPDASQNLDAYLYPACSQSSSTRATSSRC